MAAVLGVCSAGRRSARSGCRFYATTHARLRVLELCWCDASVPHSVSVQLARTAATACLPVCGTTYCNGNACRSLGWTSQCGLGEPSRAGFNLGSIRSACSCLLYQRLLCCMGAAKVQRMDSLLSDGRFWCSVLNVCSAACTLANAGVHSTCLVCQWRT